MNYTTSFHPDTDKRNYILSLLDVLRFGGGGGRLDAIAKLKRVDRTSFLEVVQGFLEDQDSEKRRVAVEALMETNPENNIEFVLPLLNDPEPDVRSEVIYRIKPWEVTLDKRVIDLFIKALREDPSPEVRVQAADILGYCRTSEAKTALLWAAEHDFESDDQGYTVSGIAKAALKRLAKGDM